MMKMMLDHKPGWKKCGRPRLIWISVPIDYPEQMFLENTDKESRPPNKNGIRPDEEDF